MTYPSQQISLFTLVGTVLSFGFTSLAIAADKTEALPNLISYLVQLSPNGVIPGLPARAEPGIQRFSGRISWIPGSASRPRNDGLSLMANQVAQYRRARQSL